MKTMVMIVSFLLCASFSHAEEMSISDVCKMDGESSGLSGAELTGFITSCKEMYGVETDDVVIDDVVDESEANPFDPENPSEEPSYEDSPETFEE